MTAFLELTRVYTLAGEVERSAHSLQSIRGYDDPSQAQKLRHVVAGLDASMDAWVKRLPECVRMAQNAPNTSSVFILSMLGRITLFAATINLREFGIRPDEHRNKLLRTLLLFAQIDH
jgi:hypothetical protein